jgi:hypothetical protein
MELDIVKLLSDLGVPIQIIIGVGALMLLWRQNKELSNKLMDVIKENTQSNDGLSGSVQSLKDATEKQIQFMCSSLTDISQSMLSLNNSTKMCHQKIDFYTQVKNK